MPAQTAHRAETEWPLTFDGTAKPPAEHRRTFSDDAGQHGMAVPPDQIQAVPGLDAGICARLVEDDVDEIEETRGQLVEGSSTGSEREERVVLGREVDRHVLQVVEQLQEHSVAKGEAFFRGVASPVIEVQIGEDRGAALREADVIELVLRNGCDPAGAGCRSDRDGSPGCFPRRRHSALTRKLVLDLADEVEGAGLRRILCDHVFAHQPLAQAAR